MLDVKCGSGALMKTVDEAKKLAESMVNIGRKNGRNVSALVTNMDVPLGRAVGNSLEVIEAVNVLKGKMTGDSLDVCIVLASGLVSSLKNISVKEAKEMCKEAVEGGKAYEKFKEWISLQGGDISYIEDTNKFPKARYCEKVAADKDGYIYSMNAEKVGHACCLMGAGRKTKTDIIDMSAGIILERKTGDKVNKGDVICYLYSNDKAKLEAGKDEFVKAFEISSEKPNLLPLILHEV